MKIGIVFGCFIPFHAGHHAMVDLAKKNCDQVIVAVCGHESDRGAGFLSFKERVLLTKEKFKNDEKIVVVQVDDDLCGCDGSFTLDNWERWVRLLFTNASINPSNLDVQFIWYTGEFSYIMSLRSILPKNHIFMLVDRKKVPISGTLIRSSPKKYKKYIDPMFYSFLEKKGVIT